MALRRGYSNNQISRINSYLLISSHAAAANLDILENSKITHIINMAAELPNHFPDTFTYLHIPAQDSLTERLSPHLDTITSFASEALTANPDAQILVHCQEGVSRSAAAALAILVQNERMRLSAAFALLKRARPAAEPNRTFLMELRWLEKGVFGDVLSTAKLTFLDSGGLVDMDWRESLRQILANAAIDVGRGMDVESGLCGLIWSAMEEGEGQDGDPVLKECVMETFQMFGGRQGRDYRARSTLARVLEYGYLKRLKVDRQDLVKRVKVVMASDEFIDLCTLDAPLAWTWGKELITHLEVDELPDLEQMEGSTR